MGRFVARKELGRLVPVDDEGREMLAKINNGKDVMVEVKQSRNIQHHRKFFALLNMVFENQEHYESRDHLLTALKIAVGHVDEIILPSGKVYFQAKSINFTSMDQALFGEFYDKCVRMVLVHFLPGVKEDELRKALLDLAA